MAAKAGPSVLRSNLTAATMRLQQLQAASSQEIAVPYNNADTMLGQAFRAIVREEVAAAQRGYAPSGGALAGSTRADAAPATHLEGVDTYSVVPFVEHVLREAGGGPLHARVIAERVYSLGFQHRWPPKYPDQLVRTINSLASPSQHPDKFERLAPRTLKLKDS